MRKLAIIFCAVLSLFAMPKYDFLNTRHGYVFKCVVPPVKIDTIVISGEVTKDGRIVNSKFLKINVDGFAQVYGNTGKPQVVESSFKIAIEEKIPVIKITKLITEKKKVCYPVFPQQNPFIYNNQFKYFEYDQNSYSNYRDTAFLYFSKPYKIREQKGVSLIFRPVIYDAKNNQLIIVKEIEANIEAEPLTKVRSGKSRHYDEYLRKVFRNLNDDIGRNIPSEQFRAREKYVIISADDYINDKSLSDFVDYRANDFDVVLKSVSELGGNNPAVFNTFLKQEQPTYALFVGKYQDFYFYQGTQPMNNLWIYTYVYYQSYGEMDNHPDFHLGLFFVRNQQALENVVRKTIYTETHLDDMGNGYVIFTGHNMPDNPVVSKDHIEKLCEQFDRDYWSKMDITLTKVYQVLNPIGDASDVVQKLNEGVRFINYNGHGWEYGWVFRQEPSVLNWTTKYGLENWGQINNNVYPFVLSCACLTGQFNYEGQKGGGPECWAETWIAHEKMGTAFIGSQQSSSFNQHALNRGFLIRLYEETMNRMGDMMDFGKEYTYDSLGTYFGDIGAEEYHLFGDPAIETLHKATSLNKNKVFTDKNITLKILNGKAIINIDKIGKYSVKVYNICGKLLNKKSFLKSRVVIDLKGVNTMLIVSIEGSNLNKKFRLPLAK